MKLYDAIMKAADQIEKNPDSFRFTEGNVPNTCGSPGCALGWIGFFAGVRTDDYAAVPAEVMGVDNHKEVYRRLTELEYQQDWDGEWTSAFWIADAALCALVLRRYAAKYHAPAAVMPDWNAIATKQTVGATARSQELVS